MGRCMRCRVTGKVQGVFYRASTARKAIELGLTGWVRNLGDGSVEVLACGDEAALTALQAWLHEGPRLARVSTVECEAAPEAEPPTAFSVR